MNREFLLIKERLMDQFVGLFNEVDLLNDTKKKQAFEKYRGQLLAYKYGTLEADENAEKVREIFDTALEAIYAKRKPEFLKQELEQLDRIIAQLAEHSIANYFVKLAGAGSKYETLFKEASPESKEEIPESSGLQASGIPSTGADLKREDQAVFTKSLQKLWLFTQSSMQANCMPSGGYAVGGCNTTGIAA